MQCQKQFSKLKMTDMTGTEGVFLKKGLNIRMYLIEGPNKHNIRLNSFFRTFVWIKVKARMRWVTGQWRLISGSFAGSFTEGVPEVNAPLSDSPLMRALRRCPKTEKRGLHLIAQFGVPNAP